ETIDSTEYRLSMHGGGMKRKFSELKPDFQNWPPES
ncbi:uncharacterized protein METZ01_LOCUS260523, partial [marine metagenome]